MKVEVSTEKLQGAVARIERVAQKHLTLPLLSCVCIEAKKQELVLKATNLEIGVEIRIPARIETEATVAVPAQILASVLSYNTHSKNVVLEVVGGVLNLKFERNSSTIKTLSADDFPIIPEVVPLSQFEIEASTFSEGLRSVFYTASQSTIKPELASVYMYTENDELYFVATDSFRLAEKKVKVPQVEAIPQLLIPAKNIPEILKILDGVDEVIRVGVDKNQISFSYGSLHCVSRLIEGTFPNYRQILPKQYTTECIVLKQDLLHAFKSASVFTDKFNQIGFELSPEDKRILIQTKNSDIGEHFHEIQGSLKGENLQVNFNYRYIIDSFQSLKADSVFLQFNGMHRPLVITGVGDPTFLYLVMPMNK